MIELTKLNGKPIFVNPHLIVTMESGADTRIYFVSGSSLLIKETHQEVIDKIVKYRKELDLSGIGI